MYLVFMNIPYGGKELEKVFLTPEKAQAYMESEPSVRVYPLSVEEWEVL